MHSMRDSTILQKPTYKEKSNTYMESLEETLRTNKRTEQGLSTN